MFLQDLYSYFGTWASMSKHLELSPNVYQIWRKKGYIPYLSQLGIEKKTNGKFKADINHGRPIKTFTF